MAAILAVATAASAQDRIVLTPHNLSISGPGTVRAATESRVCYFCHTPHNSRGVRPLWNREAPIASYQIYRSSTFDAVGRQPTGASKLCLSCHDGTIALGSVVSQAERIRMASGDHIPAGLSNLGTDLSDDHPISFAYTHGLAATDRQLESPSALPPELHLENGEELQCTTCHDAHDNTFGDFLVMDNRNGRLCTSCHRMEGWMRSSHRTSGALVHDLHGAEWPFATVAENACRSCHRPHTAGGRERLLIFRREEDNCLNCHDGLTARSNIASELSKRSAHDPRRYDGRHDPTEVRGSDRPHVECSDCHNPHSAMGSSTGVRRNDPIGPTLSDVAGIGVGGSRVERASFEYEVCFKCHGDAPIDVPRALVRMVDSQNLRLDLSTGNESAHPVLAPTTSSESVSLRPDLRTGTVMRCTDCHNNDQGPGAGGAGPDGPHGSIYPFLLERNYATRDNTPESEFAYALCYKCHRRSSILNDESFPLHRLHVVRSSTPCSACHDPHGVSRHRQAARSDHTHLINFDTSIVSRERSTGRLEFRDDGRRAGSCTLTCHGVPHVDARYR